MGDGTDFEDFDERGERKGAELGGRFWLRAPINRKRFYRWRPPSFSTAVTMVFDEREAAVEIVSSLPTSCFTSSRAPTPNRETTPSRALAVQSCSFSPSDSSIPCFVGVSQNWALGSVRRTTIRNETDSFYVSDGVVQDSNNSTKTYRGQPESMK